MAEEQPARTVADIQDATDEEEEYFAIREAREASIARGAPRQSGTFGGGICSFGPHHEVSPQDHLDDLIWNGPPPSDPPATIHDPMRSGHKKRGRTSGG